jgi:molybdenum cofactor cytidylyltransferase
MHAITPIILAAGEGKRIGRPKALLPFGSRTLLEYVVDKCNRAGYQGRLIVLGADHEKIVRGLSLSGTEVVVNENYEKGQTSSIKRALEAMPGEVEGFLIFPVDVPLVTIDECRKILAAFERGKGMIVVPSYGNKRGHPALFDITYREEFLSLGDEEPAHKIIRAHEDRITYMVTDNRFVLFDIDTEEDYRKALAELDESGGPRPVSKS